jgi:hypothetical protein
MKKAVEVALCIILVFLQSITLGSNMAGQIVQYNGIGNATAAVALSNDLFIVGSAEDNILRIYKVTAPLAPVTSIDLSHYLDVAPVIPTMIAGAAKVQERIYWISSHSRDESGKVRPESYRFFATTITERNGHITVEPVGKPYKTLLHELVDLRTVRTLGLNNATRFDKPVDEKEQQKLAPTDEGLNIGALCASHNSNMLYIAFRNPRPIRVITGTPHALVVPLDNAAEIIEKDEKPIFGEGMLWDLKGLGIVGFEYSPVHGEYFVVAASHNIQGPFVLYRWSGMKAHPPELITLSIGNSGDFFASAIVPFEKQNRILLPGDETKGAIVSSDMNSGSHTASFLAFWCQP